uniref:Uncharacterized protein n=1 Tax=Solanum lycopersicum TaxID=4081 RepID=A0A3Q7H6F1_SOLLC
MTSSTISVYLDRALALLSGTRLANIFSLLASRTSFIGIGLTIANAGRGGKELACGTLMSLLIASKSCCAAPLEELFLASDNALIPLFNLAISSAISSFSWSSIPHL